tara:strand:- start:1658 stop:1852 length:195 start_codon:yes stop_codon:yes gene_type:complete
MNELTLNEVEESISYLEDKIEKQGSIVNERDLTHLDNLHQLYNSLVREQLDMGYPIEDKSNNLC